MTLPTSLARLIGCFSYRPALGRPLSGRGSYRVFAGVLATALLLASSSARAVTGPTYVMTIGSTSGGTAK